MAIARDHRPGHIGTTPQDTDAILAGSRVVGMIADATSRLPFWPHRFVNALLGRPDVAQAADPGYFRDDTQALQIAGAVRRAQADMAPRWPDAKHLGGADPWSGD